MSARRRSVAVPVVAGSVADLDHSLVAAVLSRHSCNVTDAARDLGVPSSDLRRLLWANPSLHDAALEVVEGRLDLAERNIAESLRSDDGRERLAASMFTIRNSGRARRRGWITSAAAVDLTVGSEPPRNIVISWAGGSQEMEEIERDGKKLAVPRYGARRGDDCLEGEVATPAVLIDHAPAAAEPGVVESEPDPAPEPVEPVVVESASVRYERERIDAWIRNRLVDWPLASCLHCRRPFVAGDAWEEVASFAEVRVRARFHRSCHAEWRTEREAAARQALGLEG